MDSSEVGTDDALTKAHFFDMQQKKLASKISHEDIRKVYHIGKEIGSGKYGIVRLAAKKGSEKKKFALKSIPRERINFDVELLE